MRTGSAWWYDNVFIGGADVFFLRRRLRFGDGRKSAPFDSALVAFGATGPALDALAAALPTSHLSRAGRGADK